MEKDVKELLVRSTEVMGHLSKAIASVAECVGTLMQITEELRTDVDKLIENTQKGGVK